MTLPTFEEYVASLSVVDTTGSGAEPDALETCARAAAALAAALPLDRSKLARILRDDPHLTPVLAAAAGLSQERFKTWLQSHFGTAGWVMLARKRPVELVDVLDHELALVDLLQAQAEREWTWADVLARAMSSRQRASTSIAQGRALEDEVEKVIGALDLPFAARGRFAGTAGRTGPADFAIPGGGDEALIAIGVKGYDSTGSKLGDAASEIEAMAQVRKPTQFIFAIVDGHGWLRRRNDLRRIHALWTSDRIDGVYNLATLDDFRDALGTAARRLGLR